MGLIFSVPELQGFLATQTAKMRPLVSFLQEPWRSQWRGTFFDIFLSTPDGRNIFLTFFSGDRSGLIGVGHFFDIFLRAPKPEDIFDIFKTFF